MKRSQYQKYLHNVMRRFMQFQKEERFFVIYLFVLAFFIIFTPIIQLSQLGEGGAYGTYFLWTTGALAKTAFIVIISLLGLLGRNISSKIRNTLSIIFGFKENPFLLNFGLLWIILSSYVAIGDSLGLVQNITTRINLMNFYYITLLLVLLGLIFTLYLTIQQAKNLKHNRNIHVGLDGGKTGESNVEESDLDGLFGKLKEEEKRKFSQTEEDGDDEYESDEDDSNYEDDDTEENTNKR